VAAIRASGPEPFEEAQRETSSKAPHEDQEERQEDEARYHPAVTENRAV
jgi:hypothetical protein